MSDTPARTRGRLAALGAYGFEAPEPVILAALATGDPILLIGRSGTGKTFLLNLGLSCRDSNRRARGRIRSHYGVQDSQSIGACGDSAGCGARRSEVMRGQADGWAISIYRSGYPSRLAGRGGVSESARGHTDWR